MKPDLVKPLKPKLYIHHVNDIYSKWIKNQREKCFKKLNNYHLNIKFITQLNPSKFLDIGILIKNGITETSVAINESKIPNHWSSAVPKQYNRNFNSKRFTQDTLNFM